MANIFHHQRRSPRRVSPSYHPYTYSVGTYPYACTCPLPCADLVSSDASPTFASPPSSQGRHTGSTPAFAGNTLNLTSYQTATYLTALVLRFLFGLGQERRHNESLHFHGSPPGLSKNSELKSLFAGEDTLRPVRKAPAALDNPSVRFRIH